MSALTRERVAGGLRRGRGKSVSNQKPPVRLGLVGAGYVVESFHLPALSGPGRFKIEWICDKDLRRAETVAAMARIPRAVATLATAPDVDCVLVAVPVGARRPGLETVFTRGWHAFC